MRANFFGLEKIDLLNILTDMEFPHTIDLFSKAVDWLVGFYSAEKKG